MITPTGCTDEAFNLKLNVTRPRFVTVVFTVLRFKTPLVSPAVHGPPAALLLTENKSHIEPVLPPKLVIVP